MAEQPVVDGRYRGGSGESQLELRVDAAGERALGVVSGDLFTTSGATVSYDGSFAATALSRADEGEAMVLSGGIRLSFPSDWKSIRLEVRPGTGGERSAATVQFLTESGAEAALYECRLESRFFREVAVEEDALAGVTPFSSFDTGQIAGFAGTPRVLGIAAAYADAGVRVVFDGVPNAIGAGGAKSDGSKGWSDAELHAAMVKHFSLRAQGDERAWRVWLFHADRHEKEFQTGVMFDDEGVAQRQGAAVFYDAIKGDGPARDRARLFTCAHELGHCFNLAHSFEKERVTGRGAANRHGALSWMNYPHLFVGSGGQSGEDAFWQAFTFQFDAEEVYHLRHAFREEIIMGGAAMFVNGAMQGAGRPGHPFPRPVSDRSGLQLMLRSAKRRVAKAANQGADEASWFALGEPVVVEIKLKAAEAGRVNVYGDLHPKAGHVRVSVRKPSGQVLVYRPAMTYCGGCGTRVLEAGGPAMYESAYVGYGKDGFYFDQPGQYELRALYEGPDGSRVLSNSLVLRVRAPQTKTDEELAELYYGSEQGMLFYLLGSDSDRLARGRAALERAAHEMARHPLSAYARMVLGVNAGRAFRRLDDNGALTERPPDVGEAKRLVGRVAKSAAAGAGPDNITLGSVMRRLAGTQLAGGDEPGARATLARMLGIFTAMKLAAPVLEQIKRQAEAVMPDGRLEPLARRGAAGPAKKATRRPAKRRRGPTGGSRRPKARG